MNNETLSTVHYQILLLSDMGFPKAQYWGPSFSTCTSMICLQSVQLAMSSLMWMAPSYTFPSPVKKSKVAWKMEVAVALSLHRPCSSCQTSDSPRKLRPKGLSFFKRKWMQHSTGTGNHHALLNVTNLAFTKNAVLCYQADAQQSFSIISQ